jgi:hypothetical protein
MDEEAKRQLIQEITTLMNGRGMQTSLAEAILSMVRMANTYTERAVIEEHKGNFKESNELISEVSGWAGKVWEAHGRRPVYQGMNSRSS